MGNLILTPTGWCKKKKSGRDKFLREKRVIEAGKHFCLPARKEKTLTSGLSNLRDRKQIDVSRINLFSFIFLLKKSFLHNFKCQKTRFWCTPSPSCCTFPVRTTTFSGRNHQKKKKKKKKKKKPRLCRGASCTVHRASSAPRAQSGTCPSTKSRTGTPWGCGPGFDTKYAFPFAFESLKTECSLPGSAGASRVP